MTRTYTNTAEALPPHGRPEIGKMTEVGEDHKEVPKLLYKLLVEATPHKCEENVAKYIPKTKIDKEINGNIIIKVPTKEGKDSTTMFTCHMDTVHKEEGAVKLVDYDGFIYGCQEKTVVTWENIKGSNGRERVETVHPWAPSILGADDKAGMYVMLRMIKAKVPGMYVFHVGEERGRIGSKELATEHKELFKDIKRCISFDRKGYNSVITHQSSLRCCSKSFATALSARLNKHLPTNNRYREDDTGSFTDSYSYMDIIPECTNLSVGYFNQHTDRECLDVVWLCSMFIPAVCSIEWDDLPTQRVAGSTERLTYGGGYNNAYSNQKKSGRGRRSVKSISYINNHTVADNVPVVDEVDWVQVLRGNDVVYEIEMERILAKVVTNSGIKTLATQITSMLRDMRRALGDASSDATERKKIQTQVNNMSTEVHVMRSLMSAYDLVLSDDGREVVEHYTKVHKENKKLQEKIAQLEKDKSDLENDVATLSDEIGELKAENDIYNSYYGFN